MRKEVVIVGGGPSAVVTALTVKSIDAGRRVTLVKSIGDGVIPCAIPYMMETMAKPEENILGDAPLLEAGVEVVVGTVVRLDPVAHEVHLDNGERWTYERLVLATGTNSVRPPIKGIDKEGVYTITKSMEAMRRLREQAQAVRNVVVIGGGFIGVEFADELAKNKERTVHLVEVLPRLVETAFDDEFCQGVEEAVSQAGVKVHTGCRVVCIDGDERVESVALDNGSTVPAELVIIGAGARPSTSLAREAGLELDNLGSIVVDDYMRTSVADVFAVGDCAQKKDFFTRRAAPIWLASTATAEARIAGTNLFGIRVVRQIPGTIAAFSTQINGVAFASAGMTCRTCKLEGFRCLSTVVEAPDRHPGTLPGARKTTLKVVFAARSGLLLGAQVSGGPSVGELINVLALAIQKKMTVRELDMLQIATHPLLTAAPTVHPLVNSAHRALALMRSHEQ